MIWFANIFSCFIFSFVSYSILSLRHDQVSFYSCLASGVYRFSLLFDLSSIRIVSFSDNLTNQSTHSSLRSFFFSSPHSILLALHTVTFSKHYKIHINIEFGYGFQHSNRHTGTFIHVGMFSFCVCSQFEIISEQFSSFQENISVKTHNIVSTVYVCNFRYCNKW